MFLLENEQSRALGKLCIWFGSPAISHSQAPVYVGSMAAVAWLVHRRKHNSGDYVGPHCLPTYQSASQAQT